MSEKDQLARSQTIDILKRRGGTDDGGFGERAVSALKDALIQHIKDGGDLNYGVSMVNPSMSNFAPSIRLTLSLEMPKEPAHDPR